MTKNHVLHFIVLTCFSGLSLLMASPEARAEIFQECSNSEEAAFNNRFLPGRLDDISNFVYRAETSPFAIACRDPRSFSGRPKTGLFRRQVPLRDSKGRTSADFLKRVGQRVLDAMAVEDAKFEDVQTCLGPKKSTIECKPIRDWAEYVIKPMVKTARMNLALAQTTGQFSTLTYTANRDVNKSASALWTVKETDWDPLTSEESKTAAEILKEYQIENDEETARRVAAGKMKKAEVWKFKNDALLAARFTHGLIYTEAIARNPIMQYLKSSSPSDNEILEAVELMRKNLASDRAFAEKAVRSVPSPDSLGLMDYGSFVESELQRTPEDCALAAALHYTKENRSTGEQLAIGVPLVVVAVGLPILGQVVAGTAVGVAGSVGYTMNTKMNRDTVAQRFASSLHSESVDTYQKTDQANHHYRVSVALMPLSLGAGVATRTAAKYVMTGLSATRFGSKLASEKVAEKVTEQATSKATESLPK